MALNRISYADLNSRQKENYNFHKIAAVLADYGFNCMRMSDDYQGADFLAVHVDGETILKVQLKSRLTLGHQYTGKSIWVACPDAGGWYLYPHDQVQEYFRDQGLHDAFSRHYIPTKHQVFMQQFKVG